MGGWRKGLDLGTDGEKVNMVKNNFVILADLIITSSFHPNFMVSQCSKSILHLEFYLKSPSALPKKK